MSESAWLCKNSQCGLMFRWDPLTRTAEYTLVFPECEEFPEGAEVPMEVPVSGDTKPCGCPQCGGREIESLAS